MVNSMINKCDCYHEEYGRAVCYGTKEREPCDCNGHETECDFYLEKRKTARRYENGAELKKSVIDDLKYYLDINEEKRCCLYS